MARGAQQERPVLRPGELEAKVADLRELIFDRSDDDRNLRAIVRTLPWPEIQHLADQARARHRDGLARTPAAYFVHLARRRAEEIQRAG